MDDRLNPVIGEFMNHFTADRAHYEKLSTDVEKRIRNMLMPCGILALVTARVKNTDRLKQKLINRDRERRSTGRPPYESREDIFRDIPDLIGVRIALYFPGDTAKVEEILTSRFSIVKKKVFPEPVDNLLQDGFTAHKRRVYPNYDNRRFDGYCATHYRLRFPQQPEELPHPITIEVQVASVLMHAWSEVEHDLAYKKMMGNVTEEEYACLDEINDLVMAGEIALNRLSRLSRDRIRNLREIDTHYTLSAYLSHWQQEKGYGDRPLGKVEDLFHSYQLGEKLSVRHLNSELKQLEKTEWAESAEPLADQLLRKFEDNHRTIVKKVVIRSILEHGDRKLTEAQLGRFLGRWNTLDDKIKKALRREGYENPYRNQLHKLVEKDYILSEEIGNAYHELRMLRNGIVYGELNPSEEELNQILDAIDELARAIEM